MFKLKGNLLFSDKVHVFMRNVIYRPPFETGIMVYGCENSRQYRALLILATTNTVPEVILSAVLVALTSRYNSMCTATKIRKSLTFLYVTYHITFPSCNQSHHFLIGPHAKGISLNYSCRKENASYLSFHHRSQNLTDLTHWTHC